MARTEPKIDPSDVCSEAPDVQLNLNVRGLAPSATVASEAAPNSLRRSSHFLAAAVHPRVYPTPGEHGKPLLRSRHQLREPVMCRRVGRDRGRDVVAAAVH